MLINPSKKLFKVPNQRLLLSYLVDVFKGMHDPKPFPLIVGRWMRTQFILSVSKEENWRKDQKEKKEKKERKTQTEGRL